MTIIVFGGVSAIGLWYEIGIPGAEHGKPPPPPTKKSVKAEAERMPSKPEKPVVSVPVKTSTDGSKLENQKIKQMIEQVQQMRNEMGQVENQH